MAICSMLVGMIATGQDSHHPTQGPVAIVQTDIPTAALNVRFRGKADITEAGLLLAQ